MSIKYYNIDDTLSRDRLFNFVVGPRGVGKTYSAKNRVIKNFINKGEQFVYIRRYDTELQKSEISKFFDDISGRYEDHEFIAANGSFRIDKKIAGWYLPLSKAQLFKSVPFPHVTLIIFDEFIIDTGAYRYLPKEVTSFLEAYSTISRDRDVKAVFLSNAITFSNPYFLYFDLKLEPGQNLKLTKDISLEMVTSESYTDHMNKTRFGRLVKDTDYGKYAFENSFLRDSNEFIEPLPGNARYIATIIWMKFSFGVYMSDDYGLMWVSEKVDSTCKNKIAADEESHNSSTVYGVRMNYTIQSIMDFFMAGRMRFETMRAKNMVLTMTKGRL